MTDATGTTPPPIPPDDKDWTWVLDRACPECGFEAGAFPREQVGEMLRNNIDEWVDVLQSPDDALRRRPAPDVWSPLEYAAHVADVFAIYRQRLQLMLDDDGPHYPNWDQDESAVQRRYDLMNPVAVAGHLIDEGTRLADLFDTVDGDQWDRTGFRSDGASFTIETFARYFIHDPIHHLHDIANAAR